MTNHRALLYGSTADLVRRAVALHRQGVPLVLGCQPRHNHAITEALAPDPVTTMPRPHAATRPAAAVAALRRLAQPDRLVMLTEPDHGTTRTARTRWRRFEAACNLVFASWPFTLICAFDLRTTPDAVLAAVEESHDRFVDPRLVLARLDSGEPVAPPPAEPVLTIRGSTTIRDLGQIRVQVIDALPGLPTLLRTDFAAAVNEVLTNAYRHGRPPVDVLLWADRTRAECRVTDHGPGFDDPSAGYHPADGRAGLWLARQTCDDLDTWRGAGTFTVRLATTVPTGELVRHDGALARAETAHSRARATQQRLAARLPHRR